MKRILSIAVWFILSVSAYSQTALKIYEIQGSGASSPYLDSIVETTGIITTVFQGSGTINGYYIQDPEGDGNSSTSDGLFVYDMNNTGFLAGDEIRIVGKVKEYKNKTELDNIVSVTKLSSGNALPFLPVRFPDDFSDYECYEGMLLRFDQTLIINSVANLQNSGQLGLSSRRRRAETEFYIRRNDETAAYDSLLEENALDFIVLDDGFTGTPSPVPYVDADGVRRTGEKMDTLWAVLDQVDVSAYRLFPVKVPEFYGNPRTPAPDVSELGDFNYTICSFNVENYFSNENKAKKVVKALKAIDADVFGLCEVGQGSHVTHLLNALNTAYGSTVYATINTGLENSSTYTQNTFFYKIGKVEPVGRYTFINSPSPLFRKLLQGFRFSSGDTVLITMNHLRSKSSAGSGLDADQGDGQSNYNDSRKREAQALLTAINEQKSTLNTDYVIILGDLNALANEDPIRIFKDAGYENQTERFSDEEYSYVFNDKIQYLDYAMVNEPLKAHVTGSVPWHINADEMSIFRYDRTFVDNPYRCADHDPVILALYFAPSSSVKQKIEHENWVLTPNPVSDQVTISSDYMMKKIFIYDQMGKLQKSFDNINLNTINLSLKDLYPGLYIVMIETEEGIFKDKIIRK